MAHLHCGSIDVKLHDAIYTNPPTFTLQSPTIDSQTSSKYNENEVVELTFGASVLRNREYPHRPVQLLEKVKIPQASRYSHTVPEHQLQGPSLTGATQLTLLPYGDNKTQYKTQQCVLFRVPIEAVTGLHPPWKMKPMLA